MVPQPGGGADGTAHLAQGDAAHREAPEGPRPPDHLGEHQHGRKGQAPSPRRGYQDAGRGHEGRLEEHQHRPSAGVERGREVQADGEQADAEREPDQRPQRRSPAFQQTVEDGEADRRQDPEAPGR